MAAHSRTSRIRRRNNSNRPGTDPPETAAAHAFPRTGLVPERNHGKTDTRSPLRRTDPFRPSSYKRISGQGMAGRPRSVRKKRPTGFHHTGPGNRSLTSLSTAPYPMSALQFGRPSVPQPRKPLFAVIRRKRIPIANRGSDSGHSGGDHKPHIRPVAQRGA